MTVNVTRENEPKCAVFGFWPVSRGGFDGTYLARCMLAQFTVSDAMLKRLGRLLLGWDVECRQYVDFVNFPSLLSMRYLCRTVVAFDNPELSGLNVNVDAKRHYVYKLFDRINHPESCRQFSEYYCVFLQAEVVFEAEMDDRRMQLIRYPYVEGSSTPNCVNQVVQVLNQLLRMHKDGQVHGDIRPCNMVFGDNQSVLIDFDYAGQVGVATYPPRYNQVVNDVTRHVEAIPGSIMQFDHDITAMNDILQRFEPADDKYRETWHNVIPLISSNLLEAIATLTSIATAPLKPVTEINREQISNAVFQATGSPPKSWYGF